MRILCSISPRGNIIDWIRACDVEVASKGAYAVAFASMLFLPHDAPERVGVALLTGSLGAAPERFNGLFLCYEYHHLKNY